MGKWMVYDVVGLEISSTLDEQNLKPSHRSVHSPAILSLFCFHYNWKVRREKKKKKKTRICAYSYVQCLRVARKGGGVERPLGRDLGGLLLFFFLSLSLSLSLNTCPAFHVRCAVGCLARASSFQTNTNNKNEKKEKKGQALVKMADLLFPPPFPPCVDLSLL